MNRRHSLLKRWKEYSHENVTTCYLVRDNANLVIGQQCIPRWCLTKTIVWCDAVIKKNRARQLESIDMKHMVGQVTWFNCRIVRCNVHGSGSNVLFWCRTATFSSLKKTCNLIYKITFDISSRLITNACVSFYKWSFPDIVTSVFAQMRVLIVAVVLWYCMCLLSSYLPLLWIDFVIQHC